MKFFLYALLSLLPLTAFAQYAPIPAPVRLSPPSESTPSAYPAPSNPTGTTPVTAAPPTQPIKDQPMTAETLSSMEALNDTVKLKRRDKVSIRIVQDRDAAISREVTDTGEIDFPYIGRLKVEGQTCKQVAEAAKKLLEVDYYNHATVIVGLDVIAEDDTEPQNLVWVMGEVRSPGPQGISDQQPTTVSQVVLRSGGFTEYANQRDVRVFHHVAGDTTPVEGSKDEQIIDVKAVFEHESNKDPVVKTGDYIIVKKRFLNF